MEVPNGDKFLIAVIMSEFLACIPYMLSYNLNDGTYEPCLIFFLLFTVTANISGGHLNPAVTLGVYIERQKYSKNFCMMVMIILAQVLGCFSALALGFMLRISMPEKSVPDKYYFVPDQNAFYPKIIDEVEGLPAYGQVFFSETFGSALIVLFVLYAKWDMERGTNQYLCGLGVALSYFTVGKMFKPVSGGILNPAIGIGLIAWQNLTYQYAMGFDASYWTFEYAIGYTVGPMLGSFMGANMFSLMKRLQLRVETGEVSDDSEDEPNRFGSEAFKDFVKANNRQVSTKQDHL
jgi:glycerol uptake facilitator-like aquaporin